MVVSRLTNVAADGTFGQWMPGVGVADAVTRDRARDFAANLAASGAEALALYGPASAARSLHHMTARLAGRLKRLTELYGR